MSAPTSTETSSSRSSDAFIRAAKAFADATGQDRVIIYSDGTSEGDHIVTTWGRTPADSCTAASMGNSLKKTMGWPSAACEAQPDWLTGLIEIYEQAKLWAATVELSPMDRILKQYHDVIEAKLHPVRSYLVRVGSSRPSTYVGQVFAVSEEEALKAAVTKAKQVSLTYEWFAHSAKIIKK